MSRQALKKMIQKFEKTGDLGVVRGRERKQISNKTEEEVAFDVVRKRVEFSIFCVKRSSGIT